MKTEIKLAVLGNIAATLSLVRLTKAETWSDAVLFVAVSIVCTLITIKLWGSLLEGD